MLKTYLVSALVALFVSGLALAQGITVWTHFGDYELEWLQSQAQSFEAVFGVPVQITRLELGEIKQKMLLAAAEGQAADLVLPIPHNQLGEMAAEGVLVDMTQYATDSYLDDLSEQARLAFTVNGKLVGLPMFVEGPALIINTDLVTTPPETFEDFIALAQVASNGSFGFLYDIENFYFSYVWLHSLGGYVFGRDASGDLIPSDIGLANEGAVAGAQLLHNFQYDWELIPPGTDTAVAEGLFGDGALAMIYDGPWAIAKFRTAGIPVAVMPIPPREDGTQWSGFMGVQGVLVNRFSENQISAANFAKWITRPETQVALAQHSGRIPSSKSAAQQLADEPIIAGFAAALAHAEPLPNIPKMGDVWGPMGDALARILKSADPDIAAILEHAVSQIKGD